MAAGQQFPGDFAAGGRNGVEKTPVLALFENLPEGTSPGLKAVRLHRLPGIAEECGKQGGLPSKDRPKLEAETINIRAAQRKPQMLRHRPGGLVIEIQGYFLQPLAETVVAFQDRDAFVKGSRTEGLVTDGGRVPFGGAQPFRSSGPFALLHPPGLGFDRGFLFPAQALWKVAGQQSQRRGGDQPAAVVTLEVDLGNGQRFGRQFPPEERPEFPLVCEVEQFSLGDVFLKQPVVGHQQTVAGHEDRMLRTDVGGKALQDRLVDHHQSVGGQLCGRVFRQRSRLGERGEQQGKPDGARFHPAISAGEGCRGQGDLLFREGSREGLPPLQGVFLRRARGKIR